MYVAYGCTVMYTMYGEKKGKSRSKNPNDNILCVHNVHITHSFLFVVAVVVPAFVFAKTLNKSNRNITLRHIDEDRNDDEEDNESRILN